MGFKLIRVDSEEPCKITLVIGTHIIGRGNFLHNDDNDKRVSRRHAELEVTDDSLSLKSLHQNPCFYIKKDNPETVILHQNDVIAFSSGDKFGLLPENFWYEILQCSDSDSTESIASIIKENVINEDKCKDEVVNGTPEDVNKNSTEDPIDFDIGEENFETDMSASPSLLPPEPTDEESTQAYAVKTEGNESEPSTPNKRCHDTVDSSPIDSKRVKTQPTSPGPQPGPSNDQAAPDADDTDQKPNVNAPNSPAKPAARLRERCMYGANCYRRNPEHKARFSHPSDPDWGPGARGVCPYGTLCRRIDPRHWQNHEHPPGVNPPQPNARRQGQQRKKKMKRRASDSEDNDDGDSPQPDLIVTGKRSRKNVDRYTMGFSDSEEDEDPYKTDESDEWEPPSDFTNSEDFSQKL